MMIYQTFRFKPLNFKKKLILRYNVYEIAKKFREAYGRKQARGDP